MPNSPIVRAAKQVLKGPLYRLLTQSLRASNTARGERDLRDLCIRSVPDISAQYTTHSIESPYATEKTRCQHAFQTGLALKAIELTAQEAPGRPLTLVDIGDSSGAHLKYIHDVMAFRALNVRLKTLSVNLDPVAVKKIQDKGMEAVLCRAEELSTHGVEADIFASFEMLEHLFDPISFLHDMATKTTCSYFAITVPYVTASRVGLRYVRNGGHEQGGAEGTHIFELSADDWNLLFRFSGWEIVVEDIYTQYPTSGLLRLTQPLWKRLDFEGFYGVILRRNLEISRNYASWPH